MPGDPAVPSGYRRLFEPIAIGGIEVRNRIVSATHHTALDDDRDVRYLVERARGGAGLLGLQASPGVSAVSVGPAPSRAAPAWDHRPLDPLTPEGIAWYDDLMIPYLARRADAIHGEGAVCYAQVYHPGAAPHAQQVHPPVSPSGQLDPYDALASHVLDDEEIESLVEAFGHGIRRVREAGVDLAEIHGAHGYLVTQFLSPDTNRRTDRWGGSLENRLRFVREVLRSARRHVGPDYPIGIRLGIDRDGERHGISVGELTHICRALAPEVAYLSISGGSYSGLGDGYEMAYVSPWYRPPGHNVEAARAVREQVDVPVIVAGRIADPADAEAVLATGAADMVGMVRALIADPELPVKVRTGRAHEVRMCLGMSECHYIGPHRTPLACAVNAAAGREDELAIRRSEVARTVVVVGAGPAGMEAARVAALRGHHVYLSDREREIGGLPRLIARDDNRRNLADQAAYFEPVLRRLGVELVLGNEVGADELAEFAPDVVIVATGGRYELPDVPGGASARVVTALDVIAGATVVEGPALVVGGLEHHIGPPTVADHLRDRGVQVELISEQVDFANGAEDGTRLPLLHRLLSKGVTVSMHHRLERVEPDGAVVRDTFSGAVRHLGGVTVVVAGERVAEDRIARELKGRVPVHVVGDALAPRRIVHATLEGARAGQLV